MLWAAFLAFMQIRSRPEALVSQSQTEAEVLCWTETVQGYMKFQQRLGWLCATALKIGILLFQTLIYFSFVQSWNRKRIIYQSYGARPSGTAHGVHYVYLPI